MATSHRSIYSALLANLLIAVVKFIAGGVTHSSAMISEGVHSLVDTTNQLLLLKGIRISKRPLDETRPFGYGKELYFWSFIVSILIFGLGGGVSIYEGLTNLRNPHPLEDPTWNYVVLIISLFFEGTSFVIAWKEFNVKRGDQHLWEAITRSKDPSSFMVLFEDGAAVLGILVVFICLVIGHHTDRPYLDGVASLLVGFILIAVSFLLARESRSLLMGEAIDPAIQKVIIAMMERDSAVVKVKGILSMYQAPEEVVVVLGVVFKDTLNTRLINEAVERLRQQIQVKFPIIQHVIIQPESFEPTEIDSLVSY
jgi:cation diffusion facilitator family transporter